MQVTARKSKGQQGNKKQNLIFFNDQVQVAFIEKNGVNVFGPNADKSFLNLYSEDRL